MIRLMAEVLMSAFGWVTDFTANSITGFRGTSFFPIWKRFTNELRIFSLATICLREDIIFGFTPYALHIAKTTVGFPITGTDPSAKNDASAASLTLGT